MQPGDLRRVQEKLTDGIWADDVQSRNWAGKVVAEVMGLDAGDRAEQSRISRLPVMWKKNGSLKTGTFHNTLTGRDQTTIMVGERV